MYMREKKMKFSNMILSRYDPVWQFRQLTYHDFYDCNPSAAILDRFALELDLVSIIEHKIKRFL